MTWNYRVTRSETDDWLVIHEVYYREDGMPRAHTERGAEVSGRTLDDLRWIIDRMREALDKPILSPADFPVGPE